MRTQLPVQSTHPLLRLSVYTKPIIVTVWSSRQSHDGFHHVLEWDRGAHTLRESISPLVLERDRGSQLEVGVLRFVVLQRQLRSGNVWKRILLTFASRIRCRGLNKLHYLLICR